MGRVRLDDLERVLKLQFLKLLFFPFSVLKTDVSRRILRNSRLGRLALKTITFSFEFTIVYTYCYYHVFFNNRLYRVSLHSAWVWLFGYPLFFFYIAHICLGSMSFVVMSSRFIQVQQRALLTKFCSLNRVLEARKNEDGNGRF